MKNIIGLVWFLCMTAFCGQGYAQAVAVEEGAVFAYTNVKTVYCADPVYKESDLRVNLPQQEMTNLFFKQMKALHVGVLSKGDIEKKIQRHLGIRKEVYEALEPIERNRVFEQYLPVYADIMIIPNIIHNKKLMMEVYSVKMNKVLYTKEFEAQLHAKRRFTQQELYIQMMQAFCRDLNHKLVG